MSLYNNPLALSRHIQAKQQRKGEITPLNQYVYDKYGVLQNLQFSLLYPKKSDEEPVSPDLVPNHWLNVERKRDSTETLQAALGLEHATHLRDSLHEYSVAQQQHLQ